MSPPTAQDSESGQSEGGATRLLTSRKGRDLLTPLAPFQPHGMMQPPGQIALPDEDGVLRLAARLRQRAVEAKRPADPLTAGNLTAFGLIAEVLGVVLGRYRTEGSEHALAGWYDHLRHEMGAETARQLVAEAARAYPAPPLEASDLPPDAFLDVEADGRPNLEHVLASALVVAAAGRNPGFAPFAELFEAPELISGGALERLWANAKGFFESQPRFGPDHQTLVALLQAPARHDGSLAAQIEFILDRWGGLIDETLRRRLLRAKDRLREEQTWRPGGPAGPAQTPDFGGPAPAQAVWIPPEQAWMAGTILIAKNTPVWLYQLGQAHGRSITRLDEVPDEALAELAGRGFSALWLIGVWERSPASKRIKQQRGNLDAVASAYSLFDYRIAEDLGGEPALAALRDRAAGHGIRLAADMVPNHTGILSRWIIDHPEWFIGLDQPPYPTYRFAGPELSQHPDLSIRIEDGYWDGSDAAVVFRREDRRSGAVDYVYHGNDGTQMPWNDTAQLDFTREDVRQAVLATILEVARRFSVIRFDAAMTLTRFHYQRLWFPEPGHGGDIPTRSRFGLSAAEFNARMPEEFWQTVTAAVAEQVPDTLLVAEAFWMTEKLFVRELGMHRVYNSAFMKMLSAQENARYRTYLKDIVAQDPSTLARFVNFMTNPDEETAIALYGAGDKYLGVATLLLTLPGLPMFGHGQVEGFHEKYGMEFRRSYWEEQPNDELVGRHRRELVPLMERRRLFAGTSHFVLYDFERPDGSVDENVFAYSNGAESTRALVIYNNRLDGTSGRLVRSVEQRPPGGAEGEARPIGLTEGLGLRGGGEISFQDLRTDHRWSQSIPRLASEGLSFTLRGYESRVLLVGG